MASHPVPSLCTISTNDDEYLFAYGMDKDTNNRSTNTELYSFKTEEWSVLPKQLVDDEIFNEFLDRFCSRYSMKGGASICYDAKRNRVYVSCGGFIDCYDFNDNKWISDIFPRFPDKYFSSIVNVLFLDKLSCDQLWTGSSEVVLVYIDLNKLDDWEICEEMQFVEILEQSPTHSIATFERLVCSR